MGDISEFYEKLGFDRCPVIYKCKLNEDGKGQNTKQVQCFQIDDLNNFYFDKYYEFMINFGHDVVVT